MNVRLNMTHARTEMKVPGRREYYLNVDSFTKPLTEQFMGVYAIV